MNRSYFCKKIRLKKFNVPEFYRSPLISKIKDLNKVRDPKKKDNKPFLLDFGPVQFYIARHFGFCYGVENAIEISFRAVEENPGKKIFLLSQMIHNPDVNKDLISRGVNFLMDTEGNPLFDWDMLTSDDIVIIPAFGATLAIEKKLEEKGIDPQRYNTTCPFVERVWKKAEKLGTENHTLIIHGKYKHEETRATFSRSAVHGPSVVIKDRTEAELLADVIRGTKSKEEFYQLFAGRFSEGFDPDLDLVKVGVINQTTMLATETQEIAEFFKSVMEVKYGSENIRSHFADTRDTLCYATNENQDATYGLLETDADLALVVGGYNSSNTSHLVELCEKKFPTYFVSGAHELSEDSIHHFNYPEKRMEITSDYLPAKGTVKIIVTSGASCPDSILEGVIKKVLGFYPSARSPEEVMENLTAASLS